MTNENLPFFMAVHMDQKLFEITEIHNIIIEYTQTAVNLFWHIPAKLQPCGFAVSKEISARRKESQNHFSGMSIVPGQ